MQKILVITFLFSLLLSVQGLANPQKRNIAGMDPCGEVELVGKVIQDSDFLLLMFEGTMNQTSISLEPEYFSYVRHHLGSLVKIKGFLFYSSSGPILSFRKLGKPAKTLREHINRPQPFDDPNSVAIALKVLKPGSCIEDL